MFLIPAIIAFLITYFITPKIIYLAKKYSLIDNPALRQHPANTHIGSVPRAGGLALFFGIFIPIIIFLPVNKAVLGILIGCLITTIIGLWDDKKDLSPYLRFVFNILIALIVVGAGIGIPFITNPFGGIINLDILRVSFYFLGSHSFLILADLFALIWIVWTMNIVGWSSGVDGQMPGFIVITAIVLGIMSLKFSAHDVSQTTVATIAFITAGAFLGFLPWNFYPQKIMPGYGGKTLGGFLIAVIAILSGGKVGSALIILAIPMIDAVYIFIKRLLSHKSPFKADRNHLHHKLLDIGWGKRRIALFYWMISIILGIITLTLNSQEKLFAFLLVGVMLSGLFFWLSQVLHKSK